MSVRRIDYPSRDAQAEGLAAAVAAALAQGGTLAVPGGTTPWPFLRALSAAPLPWADIAVTLTDERMVPPDHERSNAKRLREALLTGAAAAADFIAPTAPDAEGRIAAALPLRVCVLGMGTDGHTASLFPGADQLAAALAAGAPALAAINAPGAPEPRLTLSAEALLSAEDIHLLITGPEKLTTLAAALEDGPETAMPIRAIFRRARKPVQIHYAE